MKKFTIALASILVASSAFASVTLTNKDSKSHQLLVNTSETCFAGTHTSLNSNTTSTQIDAGWACVDGKKPAVKLENGKSYIIKNGKIIKK